MQFRAEFSPDIEQLNYDYRRLQNKLQTIAVKLATTKPITIDWDLSAIDHKNIEKMKVYSFSEQPNMKRIKLYWRNLVMTIPDYYGQTLCLLPPFYTGIYLHTSGKVEISTHHLNGRGIHGYFTPSFHPHYMGDGKICLGNYEQEVFETSRQNGNLLPLIDTFVKFFSTVNETDEAGQLFPRWTSVFFEEERERMDTYQEEQGFSENRYYHDWEPPTQEEVEDLLKQWESCPPPTTIHLNIDKEYS
jgi:hypothetical protein